MRKLAVLLIPLLILPTVYAYQIPEKCVIYQIIVDRFYDGNKSNNQPFYDPTHSNYRLYWGGDLEGIIENLDYIKSLGISMVWLSPVNNNINRMASGSAPYHGYWTRDYKKIEEHFGNWRVFNTLVKEAGKRGICIIVDFVPNHSNPATDGEFGSLYDNGTFITNYYSDSKNATLNPYTGSLENIYHHNGNIKVWERFELKYGNLFGLADFNQLNPWVDEYLKDGASLFVRSGVCGFRIDAVKHMDLGWLTQFYAYLYIQEPLFIFGEYYKRNFEKDDDMFYFYQYSNVSSQLSIPIRNDIVRTFAFGGSLKTLARELERYYSHFVYPNKAVNFLDNHDLPRYLSEGKNLDRYHMALSLVMTLPGIPVIYYGDESYLVSKEGKGDPYNRPMMEFNNQTEAARIIRTLAELRKENNALAYGDFETVYADYNTWVFERKFGSEKVLVVANKVDSKNLTFSLNWSDGIYRDVLYGVKMQIKAGKAEISAPKNKVLVFSYESKQEKPLIGSITPYIAQPGQKLILGGAGFGKSGNVFIEGVRAEVLEWSDEMIVFKMPKLDTQKAWVEVYVETNGKRSNRIKLRYLNGNQKAFLLVLNASNLTGQLWIKGNISELAEPTPLMMSKTGYYFQVVSLPVNTSFSVDLYSGLPWEKLEPLNVTLYGKSTSKTIILTRTKPIPKHTQTVTESAAQSPSTSICGMGLVLILSLVVLFKKR
ncbi:alpha-amylase family glycosyl hydrolase [Thermococcus sp. SY098]|uniref:alpha-amylase family glycosyl hydrolase n=1 Tax=Thermococcus sp. SY098 TaxID=3111325 RepID=UPI002D7829BE|nr:alpha-amylase family glycosyl hydrolase [Thermococcus sp. SY098]WRS53538.1 alpha-amylase family glycosyl hydrolase [Thermococcus sp. SY098]